MIISKVSFDLPSFFCTIVRHYVMLYVTVM